MPPADLKDPLQVAVKLTHLEGVMTNLQAGVAQTNQHLRSTLEAVQADIRKLTDTLQQYGTLQHTLNDNHESIKRVWRVLEERDKAWNDRWDRFLEQQSTAHTSLRDRVMRVIYVGAGFSLAASVLAGTILFLYDRNESQAFADRTRIDNEQRAAATRSDDRLDRIEIHLAGDPDRPFRR